MTDLNTLSAPAPPHPAATPAHGKRHLLAATLGMMLEYYEFTIFAFFATFIGRAYFPATDPFASLMLSLAVFAVGFVMRPLGALIIGRLADRIGRKQAMLITIVMMTVGTLGIAATPPYHAIGVAAPIIVVLARIVQGVAFGGEGGASAAFVVEIAPPEKRNLYIGVLYGASGLGTVLAGAIGAFVAAILSDTAFEEWGWRVPFLVGVLAVPLGLYIRRNLPETLTDAGAGRHSVPIATFFRRYAYPLTLSTLAFGSTSTSVYVSYYMTTYSLTVLGLSASASISIAMASGFASMAGFALGALADRVGEWPLILGSRLLLCALCFPLFSALIAAPGLPLLMVIAGGIMLLISMSSNAMVSLVSQRFPMDVRSTVIGFSFAMGTTLFGSIAQPVAAWLDHETGNPMATAYYLIAATLVGLVVTLLIKRQIDTSPVPPGQETP